MNPQQSQVSWSDYDGVDGFGQTGMSAEAIADLNKALTTGQTLSTFGQAIPGDGTPLRPESLERTLVNTTYKAKHVVFWRNIPKAPAYSTVEQFNQLTSYGANSDAGFIGEGDLPESDDSTYVRQNAIVKYIGTTRRCSYQASIVTPAHGNVIALETINGTMHLLRIMERALFFARSNLSALQFDGMEKLLEDLAPAGNKIDLRGKPLSEDVLNDAALTVMDAPNYGIPTDLWLNPKTKADLCKAFFPKERYDLFQKTSEGMVGLDIKGFTSSAGDVRFQPDVFITDGGGPLAAVGDALKRPSAPSITTGATTPADTTVSLFLTDDVGDYFYSIQAVNRYGRATAIPLVAGPTAVTVAAGDKVTWAITPGAVVPDWYEVFRTKVNGASGTERLILRVPNTAGAGALTMNDWNLRLPGCSSTFLFELTAENMAFSQLAPMIKFPLATIDLSIRWAQAVFGTIKLKTPGHNVLLQNVGRASGYVGQP